jgi:hypothetical protein
MKAFLLVTDCKRQWVEFHQVMLPFFKTNFLKSSSTNLLQANNKGKPSTNHLMPYYGKFFHLKQHKVSKLDWCGLVRLLQVGFQPFSCYWNLGFLLLFFQYLLQTNRSAFLASSPLKCGTLVPLLQNPMFLHFSETLSQPHHYAA